jgi:hypothetical protein
MKNCETRIRPRSENGLHSSLQRGLWAKPLPGVPGAPRREESAASDIGLRFAEHVRLAATLCSPAENMEESFRTTAFGADHA